MNIEHIVYWHWLIFGMALMIIEMFSGSMTILWSGISAIFIAALLFILPSTSMTSQLFIWAVLSCILTLLWFKYIKPLMIDRTHAGISKEAVIGQCGMVIRTPEENTRGMVRFTLPVLGSDEWPFVCEQKVTIGDRVSVKEISGNTLVVEKH